MKDAAVAEVMEAFVEPADDAVADWEDVLRRAEPQADPAANGVAHTLPPVRRRPSRWRDRRMQLALALLLLAAAGAAAVVLRGGGAGPAPASAAEVTRRTRSALIDASELIVHSVARSSNGTTSDSWEDERDERRLTTMFSDGRRMEAVQFENLPGKVRFTSVMYAMRRWFAITQNTPAGAGPLGMSGSWPERLRDQLRRGDLTLVGAEELEGRDTLHLTRTLPATPENGMGVRFGPNRLDIWVDRDTYLPLRLTSTASINGMPTGSTTDYEWLPRTDANVAKTKLTIPAGFQKVKTTSSSSTITITRKP